MLKSWDRKDKGSLSYKDVSDMLGTEVDDEWNDLEKDIDGNVDIEHFKDYIMAKLDL